MTAASGPCIGGVRVPHMLYSGVSETYVQMRVSPLSSSGVKGISGALRLANRSLYDLWFLEGSWITQTHTHKHIKFTIESDFLPNAV